MKLGELLDIHAAEMGKLLATQRLQVENLKQQHIVDIADVGRGRRTIARHERQDMELKADHQEQRNKLYQAQEKEKNQWHQIHDVIKNVEKANWEQTLEDIKAANRARESKMPQPEVKKSPVEPKPVITQKIAEKAPVIEKKANEPKQSQGIDPRRLAFRQRMKEMDEQNEQYKNRGIERD